MIISKYTQSTKNTNKPQGTHYPVIKKIINIVLFPISVFVPILKFFKTNISHDFTLPINTSTYTFKI